MDADDLDAERLYGMDGRDRKALKLALAGAVLTWNRLNELVDGLGWTLSDYAAQDMPLPSVVFAVIGGARAEGWLAELVAEAVTTYPGNQALASFARRFVRAADPVPEFPPSQWSRRDVGQSWGGRPGPALAAVPDRRVIPRRLRATSTVYFDLRDVEAELVATRDASGPLAAFATTYADESYLDVLRERFGYVFPDTAVPDVLSLSDHLMSPERAATEVAELRAELTSAHVLFVVRVDRPSRPAEVPASLASFWRLMCAAFAAGAARRVLLLFAVHPEVGLPDGIRTLPDPVFTAYDVWRWAAGVLDEAVDLGWPIHLRDALRDELCARARHATSPDRLDPRRLYQAMRTSIQLLQTDPDEFRRKLEGKADG